MSPIFIRPTLSNLCYQEKFTDNYQTWDCPDLWLPYAINKAIDDYILNESFFEICPVAASYSMPFNVLDYVAGVVPVTKVTLDDVTNLDDYYPSTPAIYRKIKQVRKSHGLC